MCTFNLGNKPLVTISIMANNLWAVMSCLWAVMGGYVLLWPIIYGRLCLGRYRIGFMNSVECNIEI